MQPKIELKDISITTRHKTYSDTSYIKSRKSNIQTIHTVINSN